jgi:hypothetical protein
MSGESLKPENILIVGLLKAARELPAEDLPGLIGQLEAAKATAWARLAAPAPAQSEYDELLGVAEAARRLGVSEDYLYSHHRGYPFTRRQGRKLLFSALGIDNHIRQQKT